MPLTSEATEEPDAGRGNVWQDEGNQRIATFCGNLPWIHCCAPLCWYTSAEGVQEVAYGRTPVTACHWLAVRSPLGGDLRERPKPRMVIGQNT